MARKIDPESGIKPDRIRDERGPGIPARSADDEAEFESEGRTEEPAEVTEAQRRLEGESNQQERREPGE